MTITERRVKTAMTQAVRQRNYRRIRDRALRRLGNLYPDQYRELLEEERAKDEAQGKVWLDISGRTNASLGLSTDNSQPSEVANGFSNQGKAG
jgi:hypothetical protein